jgi:hypothetical protein
MANAAPAWSHPRLRPCGRLGTRWRCGSARSLTPGRWRKRTPGVGPPDRRPSLAPALVWRRAPSPDGRRNGLLICRVAVLAPARQVAPARVRPESGQSPARVPPEPGQSPARVSPEAGQSPSRRPARSQSEAGQSPSQRPARVRLMAGQGPPKGGIEVVKARLRGLGQRRCVIGGWWR